MIRLRTLGALDLTDAHGVGLRAVLSQPRRMALLVYLALTRPRGFQRRDHVVTLFWPEDDAEHARSSLNRAIYFLRRELGDGVILSQGTEELGINFERFWCDAAAFEDALDDTELARALELYRGDLLPGFFTSRAEGFERWLETTRSRLRDRAADAAWCCAADNESRGELALAAVFARRAVDFAPFDEIGVRRLLTLLGRAGDRAGAARSYQEFEERMARELDLAPSVETRTLIEDIRSGELTSAVSTQVAPTVPMPTTGMGEAAPATPAGSHAAHKSTRRMWVISGAVATTAALTVALAVPTFTTPYIDPRTVYVIPFSNRTADRSLDDLGRVAADRIVQSLSSTGLVNAAPPNDDASAGPFMSRASLPEDARKLAAGSGAGTIVSGQFHLEAGRIVVQAWITDARRSRVAWAIRTPNVPADSALRAIDEVSRRITGAVAALRTPSLASWFPIATSSPPTFEAFQEFAEASELQSRGFDQDAVPHLRRAVALDTTFTWARLQLASAYYNLFEQGAADSIADALNGDRPHLNPLQRHWLAWMLTVRTEDKLAGYRAMRAAAELAPDRFLFNVAQRAMALNRPREAIDVLERLGPDGPHVGSPGAYWGLLTRGFHAVGDGQRELRAARAARRANMEPMTALSFEIRALASLGMTDAVQALLDTALTLPMEHGPTPLQLMVGIARISSPGQLMVATAQELRAHGHEDEAQTVLARALAWYRAQPTHGAISEARRFEIAHALYLTRDWAAADTAFLSLAAADTANIYYLGFLGTIAARRNDEAKARHIIARFDSLRPSLPQPRAIAGYWQAKISSILGDEQHALVLLAEVWPQGDVSPHMDFDHERMWKADEFRRFIRPKG